MLHSSHVMPFTLTSSLSLLLSSLRSFTSSSVALTAVQSVRVNGEERERRRAREKEVHRVAGLCHSRSLAFSAAACACMLCSYTCTFALSGRAADLQKQYDTMQGTLLAILSQLTGEELLQESIDMRRVELERDCGAVRRSLQALKQTRCAGHHLLALLRPPPCDARDVSILQLLRKNKSGVSGTSRGIS